MSDVKLTVGGTLADDAAAFLNAWHRAEDGDVAAERALVFESWDALSRLMTGERYRLLRHIHAHPEPSISALARSLGRQYRRVHDDVTALVAAGLIERDGRTVHVTANQLTANIRL